MARNLTSWPARAIGPLLVLFTILCGALPASAADLRTEVSARRVGVGQTFEVSITAVQQEGDPEPENPRLTVQGDAIVRGPSISSQRKIMMRNFNFDSEESVVARFSVTPKKTGKLVVGPGTFRVGNKLLRGEAIVVEVVEQAQTIQRPRPFGPRDIFGDDPSDIFGDDPLGDIFRRRRAGVLPPAPEEYLPPSVPDETAFLHVVLDKKSAVLGAPIRLSVLAFGSRGNFREISPNEPSLPDFLSYSVVESSHDEPTYLASLDGREFIVRKLREFILIPLRTGELPIGSMSAVLQGARGVYPISGSPLGFTVKSAPLSIRVIEPPTKGRPDGYFLGDVGSYNLEVDLHPTELTVGEYAEVIVTIKGEGQIPSKVLVPESSALSWEAPTVSGGPEVIDGKLQGTRVLKYAVRINEPGRLALGEVTLPYFDPQRSRYLVARAALPDINAVPARTPPAAAPKDTNQSGNQTGTSATGLPYVPRQTPMAYSPPAKTKRVLLWPWLLLLGLPLSTAFLSAAQSVGARWFASREASPKTHAGSWLKQAQKSASEGQEGDVPRKLERALFEAIENTTSLNVRGVLREQLAQELERAGLPEILSQKAETLLSRLDQVRYDPNVASTSELLKQTESLVQELTREEKAARKRRQKSEAAS